MNRVAVRAWTDPVYRSGLSDAERADLPDNPAGLIEPSDEDAFGAGAAATLGLFSFGCCMGWTLLPDWFCS
ncbi:mersacidin/lichenicidin family type 2 lantibiotic [Micromonospora sp. NIE79]|uniref:Mersacidin/lichenicidin family type 2 lantibiotic n=1 Tax=Micromonospora trifolii TaxID=2911208 RepID=A0ABS9N271_9ACTN|nr:mersacidin/lichenicidin family type 2 lantibiotic [Micromonospora trifolii]MCG5444042.1 mersacidin/lichenicidin family type 2 lantibiotic [Micromonospora trifolii]